MNTQNGKKGLFIFIVLLLFACNNNSSQKTTQTNPTVEPKDAVEVMAAMQKALHDSPDNLRSRAQNLVEDADPIKLYEFVRDEIRTYPPTNNGFDDFDNEESVRWGIKGTLRGGAGTPREKAELFADLYNKAGFESKVIVCDMAEEAAGGFSS